MMSQYARSARLPVAANHKKKNRREVRAKRPGVRTGSTITTSRPLEPGVNAATGASNYRRDPLVSTENRVNSATTAAVTQKFIGNEVSMPKGRWQRNHNNGPSNIVHGNATQQFHHQPQHQHTARPLPRQQQQPQANFHEFSQLTDNFTYSSGSSNGSQNQNTYFNSDESPEYHEEQQQQQQQMQVHQHQQGQNQNYAHHSMQGQDTPSNLLTMRSAASSNNNMMHSNQHQMYCHSDNNSKISSSSENDSSGSGQRFLPPAREQYSRVSESNAPMTSMQAPKPRLQQKQQQQQHLLHGHAKSNMAGSHSTGENLLYKPNAWKRALAQITPRRNNTIGSRNGGSTTAIDNCLAPCLSHPLLQPPSRTQAVAVPPREPAATTTTSSSEPFTPRKATALIRSLLSQEQEERTHQLAEAVEKVQSVQAKCEGVLAKCEGVQADCEDVQEENVAKFQNAEEKAIARVEEAEAKAVAKIQEEGNLISEEHENCRMKASEEFTVAKGEIETLCEKASENYKQHEAGIRGLVDQLKSNLQQTFQTLVSNLPSLPAILPTNPFANRNKRKATSSSLSNDKASNGWVKEAKRDGKGRFIKRVRVTETETPPPTRNSDTDGSKTKESNASLDCTSNARKRKADKEESSEAVRRSKRIRLTGKAADDATKEAKSAQSPTVSTASTADKPSNDETRGAASATSAADKSFNDEMTRAKYSQRPTVSAILAAGKSSNNEMIGVKSAQNPTLSTASTAGKSSTPSSNDEMKGAKSTHSPAISIASTADKSSTPSFNAAGAKSAHSPTVSTASAADKSSTLSSPIIPVTLVADTPREVKHTKKHTAPPVRRHSQARKNGKGALKTKPIITTPTSRTVTCKYPTVVSLHGSKKERKKSYVKSKTSSVTPPLLSFSSPAPTKSGRSPNPAKSVDPTKSGRLARRMRKSKQISHLKFSPLSTNGDPTFF